MQIIKSLRRQRTFTILNVVGLSVAFATFILLCMQIRYDAGYNIHVENPEQVFMLNIKDKAKGENAPYFNRQIPLSVKAHNPHIEYISIMGWANDNNVSIYTTEDQDPIHISEIIVTIEPDFIHIHDLDFIEGDTASIRQPGNIIISEAYAAKYFGDTSPIGKRITCAQTDYTVSAVFRTLPQNSSIYAHFFTNIGDENLDNPGNYNYNAYGKFINSITPAQAQESVTQMLNDSVFLASINLPAYITEHITLEAIPLSEVRSMLEGYDNSILYTMIALAVVILLLASINFINFSMAMAPLKVKEINIRKIFGAGNATLRIGIVMETLLLTIASFALSIFLVLLFMETPYRAYLSETNFEANRMVYLFATLIAILIGLVAGIYPAMHSTRLQAAMAVRSRGNGGKHFRATLITFQFFIAISFLTAALLVQRQHAYMNHYDMGYQTQGIITAEHGYYFEHQNTLKETLLQNAQFTDVTYAAGSIGAQSGFMTWTRSMGNTQVQLLCIPVAHNFMDFFGIKLLSGRQFTEADEQCENGLFLMSQLAMDTYDIKEGTQIDGHRDNTDIIGICENIQLANSKVTQEPFCLFIFGKNGWYNLPNAYFKYTGDTQTAIQAIKDAYHELDPTLQVEPRLMTDNIARAYRQEKQFKDILLGFSLVAIIIALVGVFGLVQFDTQHRRREIGIRKVNGATERDVLRLFSFGYLSYIAIGLVLSIPVVLYGINMWLEQFPHRAPVAWWIFALSTATVIGLTLTVAIAQTWKAARENPVLVISG